MVVSCGRRQRRQVSLALLAFIFGTFSAKCLGVSVECTEGDDNKNLKCAMAVDYDEIARAWNMKCERSENGLKCHFGVEKKLATTMNFVTPSEQKIELCSGDGFCIRSSINTQVRPIIEPVSYPMISEERSSVGAEQLEENEVKIGKHVYKRPFDQYAPPVADMLTARATLWGTNPVDPAYRISLAHGYLDLGIAHFSSARGEYESPEKYLHFHDDSFNVELAINAFQEAERRYLNIIEDIPEEKNNIECSLAALYLQWGEVVQNPLLVEEDDEAADYAVKVAEGLFHYRRSEDYYRLCLEASREGFTTQRAKDAQINLAHVLVRVGRSLISSIRDVYTGSQDLESYLENARGAAAAHMQQLTKNIPEAHEKFEEAVRLYRKTLEEDIVHADAIQLKNALVAALRDYAAAATYASDIPKSVELEEESIKIAKEILPDLSAVDLAYVKQFTADSLYNLANNYMQLGKYDETKSRYQDAMDWYEKFKLEVQPDRIGAGMVVDDQMLEAYEKQLSDYHELLRNIRIPDRYHDEHTDPLEYGPNDAYEADLHGALGSIHLARHEVLLAIEHFNQAIRLYENDKSGENLDRSIANVKTSLAAAYFMEREFQKSADMYHDAMDIYRATVGEGKNPLMEGLAEQLGNDDMLNHILEQSGLDESQLQALLSGAGYEDLLEKLNLPNGGKRNGDADVDGREKAEPQKGEQNKVHEELIDIQKLRHIINNATAAASTKEEL